VAQRRTGNRYTTCGQTRQDNSFKILGQGNSYEICGQAEAIDKHTTLFAKRTPNSRYVYTTADILDVMYVYTTTDIRPVAKRRPSSRYSA
jgi:hypothetical protein